MAKAPTEGGPTVLRSFVWQEDLATELDVPLNTLRHWRRTGTGPRGFRLGRRVAYERDDVRRWLDMQRSKGA